MKSLIYLKNKKIYYFWIANNYNYKDIILQEISGEEIPEDISIQTKMQIKLEHM